MLCNRHIRSLPATAGRAFFPGQAAAGIIVTTTGYGTSADAANWDAAATGPSWRAEGGAPPTDQRAWYWKFSSPLSRLNSIISTAYNPAIGISSRSVVAYDVKLYGVRTNFTPANGQAIGALTTELLTTLSLVFDWGGGGVTAIAPGQNKIYLGLDAGGSNPTYYGLKLVVDSVANDGSIQISGAAPAVTWGFGL